MRIISKGLDGLRISDEELGNLSYVNLKLPVPATKKKTNQNTIGAWDAIQTGR